MAAQSQTLKRRCASYHFQRVGAKLKVGAPCEPASAPSGIEQADPGLNSWSMAGKSRCSSSGEVEKVFLRQPEMSEADLDSRFMILRRSILAAGR